MTVFTHRFPVSIKVPCCVYALPLVNNTHKLFGVRRDVVREPAHPSPPPPPPPRPLVHHPTHPLPRTYHYGPKMYLRVSRTQFHLFPGQPLGCTGVIAHCASVPPCVQPVADCAQFTKALFKSRVHYIL